MDGTLREDYEQFLQEGDDGTTTYHCYYKCACPCGFKWEHEHHEPVYVFHKREPLP